MGQQGTQVIDDDIHWTQHAACAGSSYELWFPTTYGHLRVAGGQYCNTVCHICVALRICKTCPVIAECLHDGLQYERSCKFNGNIQRIGIFGGTTPRERNVLWKNRSITIDGADQHD